LGGVAYMKSVGERKAQSERAIATENAERARHNEQLANDNLAEVLRLADVKRLNDRRLEAEQLWPEIPRRIDAMKAWLAQARDLTSRLGLHRETLDRMRRQAARVGDSWHFADETEQWRHDTLAGLVSGLEAMLDSDPRKGLIADIERRLQEASTIVERTIDQYAEQWDETRQAILESPRDGGLDLEPQVGLVPLGKDAKSGLVEFAMPRSGAIPSRNDAGKLVITAETGFVFVLIPGGTFAMGAQMENPAGENYDPDADPEH